VELFFGGRYFNSGKEFKELFFRSKNGSRYGGDKITPKRELSAVTKVFTTLSESK